MSQNVARAFEAGTINKFTYHRLAPELAKGASEYE